MSLVFSLTLIFKEYWQPWLPSIENAQLVLITITAILAAQFNRSRLTLLCFSWLVLISIQRFHPVLTIWLSENNDWLVLTFLVLFSYLGMIKDRALFSVHGAIRLLSIVLCGVFAHLWLILVRWCINHIDNEQLFYQLLPMLKLGLPILGCGIFLLISSLLKKELFQTSLLLSFVIWIVYNNSLGLYLISYQEYRLPWSVVISLLTMQYLLAVIIDVYYLAYRDDLTALPSRRALNQYALSLGRKYTVAMLDIDHFKKFNDSYGHDIGDQVLKLVAAKLAKVKGGGRVFRYGGEEFTVVFSGKNLEQCIDELETLRQSIADYEIVIRQPQRSSKKSRSASEKSKNKSINKTVGVTISIGVAEHQSKAKFEQSLKLADEALYRAKNNGRNNVSH